MAKQVIFSGIQPSGNLHIGNYLGAIKQWVNLQNQSSQSNSASTRSGSEKTDLTDSNRLQPIATDLIFCIVDLHAITVPQNPQELQKNVLDTAAWYLAAGLDGEKSTIFVQSENPDHPYLAWIFDCTVPMGWMERMTQYKDKSSKQGERTSVGLFSYPALMAADILLYDTDLVPVGEDQIQHVELARDIAEKFNHTFGDTFKIPKIMLQKNVARIKSLQNPEVKMSKSVNDPNGTINLTDSNDQIKEKISRAMTDSGSEIQFSEDKPAISNLLSLYSAFGDLAISEIEEKYRGKNYSQFKSDLAEVIIAHLSPIKKKYEMLIADKTQIEKVLDSGEKHARKISSAKITSVKTAIGISR